MLQVDSTPQAIFLNDISEGRLDVVSSLLESNTSSESTTEGTLDVKDAPFLS